MYILYFIAVIMLIIFVHEFGHFAVARFFGVRVDVFSIGLGKTIFSFKDKKGTAWKICAVPLGGYVKMFDDQDDSNVSGASESSFRRKARWKKALIVLGGPFANYLLTLLVLALLAYFNGVKMPGFLVSHVNKDSIAFDSGIRKNDIIIERNGVRIRGGAGHDKMQLTEINKFSVFREGKFIYVVANSLGKVGEGTIGDLGITVLPYDVNLHLGFFASLDHGFRYVNRMCHMIITKVSEMLSGSDESFSQNVSSIIGMVQGFKSASVHGFSRIALFLAILSANLCVLNLLPIPVLDGGHLFCYLIEWGLGRNLSLAFYRIYYKIGSVIIMFIMMAAMLNDIINSLSRFFNSSGVF